MRTAVAIRHLHFEDLGTLEPLLYRRGYQTCYYDAGVQEFDSVEIERSDLLVMLGGPIGAFDEDAYPFLISELRLIEQRIASRRPLLGICLGAQLMARVLGAAVAPMQRKEIGFSPITLTAAGRRTALAAIPAGTPVLHWHGDQFAMPHNVESLAGTSLCPHQAFALGSHAFGLQFHLELNAAKIERWLIGHSAELAQAGIAPGTLRDQARAHGAELKIAADTVFNLWLDQMELQQS